MNEISEYRILKRTVELVNSDKMLTV